jgi:transcription initiation protein SPT3
VEDLIFLLRHDREKLNRIRTYLSWKDVRKKVKDSEGADEELDNMEGEPAGEFRCTSLEQGTTLIEKRR